MTDERSYQAAQDQAAPQPVTTLPNEEYYRQPPQQRGGNRRLGGVLLLVGVVWLAFELLGRGFLFGGVLGNTTLLDRTAAAARGIELDAGSADVEVRAWNQPGVRVEAIQHGGRRDDYSVNYRESGDTVYVSTGQGNFFCLFCNRDLNYIVFVPIDGQITVRTSSGNINLADVSGAAANAAPHLTTTSGDVEARGLEHGLTVNTTSGEVKLNDIAGPLTVNTTSGDVELDSGRVSDPSVKTTSGQIDLQGVSGSLDLASSSGDIRVRDARDARLTVATTSGEVSYDGSLALSGASQINTLSGDVRLRVPRESSFRVQANTVSGDLSIDGFSGQQGEPNGRTLTATVGSGSASLTIETTGGDVEMQGN